MKKRYKSNSFVIGALVLAIAIMTVGYAALSANLKISGTAKITSTWNVAIESITKVSNEGSVEEVSTPTSDGTTASFNVNLKSPGDSITYDIVIANTGNLDATLNSITTTPDAATSATTGIKYTITGNSAGDNIANTTGKHKITVKVEWVSTDTSVPETTSQNIAIALNYVQKAS